MPIKGTSALRAVQTAVILTSFATIANAQASDSLGNGLSAAAIARGGNIVAQRGDALDSVQGNPAGLAGITTRSLDVTGVGVFGSGTFQNSANTNGKLSGVVGALPYGAFATPLKARRWTASAAFTPEILMRANWRYVDAPGTAGASYGLQDQETQIIAVRTSAGLARNFGSKWSAGVTLGFVYNTNDLNAPYIFQQQPQLAGLKVLLALKTHGYGWNGSAGVLWQPTSHLRAGLAWKSGTTIRTHGDASGTASAQFAALGITTDPTFHYQAEVMNHLPQAFDAGISWQLNRHILLQAQGDFTAWGQAYQQLPVTLTQGTNAAINSIAGSTTLQDAVPLHWKNQTSLHLGVESPIGERWTARVGYTYMTNPVPSATLLPLTATILRNAVAAGAGWTHGRWRWDAAYQAQLPSTQYVSKSQILAGEYDNSKIRIMLQSVTLTAQVKF